MMPMRVRCKARRMEKVEILYRSATIEKFLSINTPLHFTSRLRDMVDINRSPFTIEQRPPQRDHVKHQHHDQPERNARKAGDAAREQRHEPGCREHADLVIVEAAF